MSEESGSTLKLEICTLDRSPVVVQAREVSVPGAAGIFTVLPEHATLASTLAIGVLTASLADGAERAYAISGGFIRVQDNHVVVLTQTAEEGGEIDLERAEAARERSEELLRSLRDSGDVARAEAGLKRAIARISAYGRRAKTGSSVAENVER